MDLENYYLIPKLGNLPLYLEVNHEIEDFLIPVDFPIPKISVKDLIKFNLHPIKYYSQIVSPLGSDPSPSAIANLLFFSQISPHAISQILFLSGKLKYSFLYSFFAAPITEYMDFLKALKILFSRIALPLEKDILLEIFKYSGKVLYSNGFFINTNEKVVIAIVMMCIFFSSMRAANASIPFIYFSEKCHQLADLSKLKPLTLERIYKELDESPIPLLFTFADTRYPPFFNKSGILMIKQGVMKLMKKRFFIIKQDALLYSNPETPNDFIGGIELDDVKIIIPAPKEKNPLSFMLINENDKSIHFEISKGKKNLTEKTSITLYTNTIEDLESWRSSILHYTFRKTLSNIISPDN